MTREPRTWYHVLLREYDLDHATIAEERIVETFIDKRACINRAIELNNNRANYGTIAYRIIKTTEV